MVTFLLSSLVALLSASGDARGRRMAMNEARNRLGLREEVVTGGTKARITWVLENVGDEAFKRWYCSLMTVLFYPNVGKPSKVLRDGWQDALRSLNLSPASEYDPMLVWLGTQAWKDRRKTGLPGPALHSEYGVPNDIFVPDDAYAYLSLAERPFLGAREARQRLGEVKDWVQAVRPDLGRYTFHEALAASRAWHASLHSQEDEIQEGSPLPPAVVLFRWPDGAHLDRLVTREQFVNEGHAMNHCVGGYHYWEKARADRILIVSYRDPEGVPQATVELDKRYSHEKDDEGVVQDKLWLSVEQIQGPGDSTVTDKTVTSRLFWALNQMKANVSPHQMLGAVLVDDVLVQMAKNERENKSVSDPEFPVGHPAHDFQEKAWEMQSAVDRLHELDEKSSDLYALDRGSSWYPRRGMDIEHEKEKALKRVEDWNAFAEKWYVVDEEDEFRKVSLESEEGDEDDEADEDLVERLNEQVDELVKSQQDVLNEFDYSEAWSDLSGGAKTWMQAFNRYLPSGTSVGESTSHSRNRDGWEWTISFDALEGTEIRLSLKSTDYSQECEFEAELWEDGDFSTSGSSKLGFLSALLDGGFLLSTEEALGKIKKAHLEGETTLPLKEALCTIPCAVAAAKKAGQTLDPLSLRWLGAVKVQRLRPYTITSDRTLADFHREFARQLPHAHESLVDNGWAIMTPGEWNLARRLPGFAGSKDEPADPALVRMMFECGHLGY